MSRSIGFIGLGAMGSGMALNLLRAGFELRIWNRSTSKMDALLEEGAIPAENPADLASSSEISIVCVVILRMWSQWYLAKTGLLMEFRRVL